MSNLTFGYANRLFHYRPKTGLMFWRPRPLEDFKCRQAHTAWNTRYAGKEAGTHVGGYVQVRVNKRPYYTHRVAWLITFGVWPTEEIDHIDGNPSNNRIGNLRSVSHSENLKNVRRNSANTSGRTGVSWSKATQKWEAYIKHRGTHHHLGHFSSFAEACAARDAAEIKYGFHSNHGR